MIAIFIVGLTYMLLGCNDNTVAPIVPKLATGASIKIVSQNILQTGGVVVVNKTGSTINGLTINIPDSAYTDGRTFNISTSEISKHEFGKEITILTPLITISNGGGYSNKPMTIRVPVKIPAGQFALAFQYDESTQKIEALPLIYEDSTEVQFITRHFANSDIAQNKVTILDDAKVKSSIFISSIDAATLDGTFDTGFEMGIDNFQFVNWGSYIAIGGHCGGQSIATMWYYNTKKKSGSPGLYGIFDNDGINRTPEIWFDDVHAYRFCSVIQKKMHWTNMDIYRSINKNWDRDLVTYRSIAFAIRETGISQCLYVSNDSIAHAIVAYKTSNGRISVCDPNFPEQEKREIVFNKGLGDFEPYYSGSNAGSVGRAYHQIYLAANSALIDYDLVKDLYNQTLRGTIGNDLYPLVSIKVRNSNNDYVELKNGITIPQQVTLDVSAFGFQPSFIVWDYDTKQQIAWNVRDFKLSTGKHKIGVYYHDPFNQSDNSGYIGFNWYDIDVENDDLPIGNLSIRLNVSIDGKPVTVKDTPPKLWFNPSKSVTWFQLITELQDNSYLVIFKDSISYNGVGTYVIGREIAGPAHYTQRNNQTGDISYFSQVDDPGTLTISGGGGKLRGTFSFHGHLFSDPKKVKIIEGEFFYP